MTAGPEETPGVVTRLNVRIAELVKETRAEDIVEILSGPEASLLRMAEQQQQQQQQQQVARPPREVATS